MTALTRAAVAGGRSALDRVARFPREAVVAGLIMLAGIVLAGSVPEFRAQEWSLYLIYGLLALSFTFVWGHGGIFSFGQAALFGIGGYSYGVVGINLIARTGETLTAVAAGVVVAALSAGLLGYFMFYGNVGDVYVAIITLATSLVLSTVMSSTAGPEYRIGDAQLGGYNGMIGVPPLSYGTPGDVATPLALNELLVALVALAVLVTVGLRILLRRPFGRILVALRANEQRTLLLGYDVRRHKLIAFVIAGAIAGLAGALYAAWGTFINPAVFGLGQAALVAIWVLVGGRTSLLGAFVGVILMEQVSSRLGGSGSTATPIVLGSVLIAVVLLLPQGIVPTLRSLATRLGSRLGAGRSPAPAPAAPDQPFDRPPPATGRAGASLAGIEVGKRFGGVTALDDVTAEFPERGVHCLIGPNGAGKSTFFNLLVGRYSPTRGRVLLEGEEITRRRPDERAQLGIGIKLQVASLYDDLSAFENVWLAAYARKRDVAAADERATAVLDWLGLLDRRADSAGALSHGERQWLEIGMVMASEPRVVLLDEPTAGMTREETERTARLVTALGEHATVIVVEHDMEFVRHLDAPITMFHEGRVFTRGSLAELRQDGRVLDVYLGRRAHAEA